ISSNDPLLVLHQELQRLEFRWGKGNQDIVAASFHAGEICGYPVERDGVKSAAPSGSPQCNANPCQQFAWTERLSYIVICAELQQQDFVGNVAGGAKHDDRSGRRMLFDLAADVPARKCGE